MTQYRVEADVPLPPPVVRTGCSEAIRALASSEVGQSVFVPGLTAKEVHSHRALRKFARGWFASRTVTGGARLWKISDPRPAAGSNA